VFSVTAEANLGEGKTERRALLPACEGMFILTEFKSESFSAVESQSSVKVTLTGICSEGRIRALKYAQSSD